MYGLPGIAAAVSEANVSAKRCASLLQSVVQEHPELRWRGPGGRGYVAILRNLSPTDDARRRSRAVQPARRARSLDQGDAEPARCA